MDSGAYYSHIHAKCLQGLTVFEGQPIQIANYYGNVQKLKNYVHVPITFTTDKGNLSVEQKCVVDPEMGNPDIYQVILGNDFINSFQEFTIKKDNILLKTSNV